MNARGRAGAAIQAEPLKKRSPPTRAEQARPGAVEQHDDPRIQVSAMLLDRYRPGQA